MKFLGKVIGFVIGGCIVLFVAVILSEELGSDEFVARKLGVSIDDCKRGLLSMQLQANVPGVMTAYERSSLCSMRVPKSLPKEEVVDYWVKHRGW